MEARRWCRVAGPLYTVAGVSDLAILVGVRLLGGGGVGCGIELV